MRSKVLLVLFISAWLVPSSAAQTTPAAGTSRSGPAAAESTSVSMADLLSTWRERSASALQFTVGVSDVADFKVDVTGAFTPNPDDSLWKATTKIKGSALFPSVAELNSAYTKAADYRKQVGASRIIVPEVASSVDGLTDYFSRRRTRDRMARFLSGFTVSGSILERAELEFGLVGRPTDVGERTKWSFDVTFDPTPLFTTAAEKKSAYEAAVAYMKLDPDRGRRLTQGTPCTSTPQSCLDRLGGLTPGKAILATLIPTVKFESIDEFDYALIGGQPVLFPESSQDGALQSVLFTWDLLKIIRPSSAKLDAVAAMKAHRELLKLHQVLQKQLEKPGATLNLRNGEFVIRDLEPASDDLEWSRWEEGVWNGGTFHLTKDGVLIGQAACPAQSHPCEGHLSITVKDAAGREAMGQITLRISR